MNDSTLTLLRINDVRRRTGLSRNQVYRLAREGQFPTGIRISPRCTCWSSTEIEEWIRSRIKNSRQQLS